MKAVRLLSVLAFFISIASADTIKLGTPLTLQATADGNPAPTFEWFRGGVSVGTGATLTIASVATGDAGSYTVKATNEVGSAVSPTFVIDVDDRVAPTIASAPLDARISEGQNLTLSVVANGSPAPSYQWAKNGTAIPGATTARLAFNPITRSDAGNYTVTVTNEVGSVVSAQAKIDVLFAPSAPIITRPLSNVAIPAKSALTLSIDATVNPGEKPVFKWQQGTKTIAGATTNSITIASVKPSDAGVYAVTVSNGYGKGTSSATVTVLK